MAHAKKPLFFCNICAARPSCMKLRIHVANCEMGLRGRSTKILIGITVILVGRGGMYAIALPARYIPARRSAQTDSMVALRYE